MQVQPGFSLLQALSGGLQRPGAGTQRTEPVQPVRAVTPAQKGFTGDERTPLSLAGINMNAPRGTYLNIRV